MTADRAVPKTDKPESSRKPLSQFLFASNGETPHPNRTPSSTPEPIIVVETDTRQLHFAENCAVQTAYLPQFNDNSIKRIDYPLYDTVQEPETDDFSRLPKQPILPVTVSRLVKAVPETARKQENVPGAPFPLDDFSELRPTLFRRYLSIFHEKQARQRLACRPVPAISVSSTQSGTCQNGAVSQNGQYREEAQGVCSDAFFSSLSPEARDSFRQFLRSLG